MVDHARLVALAERADCRLEFLWAVGDFVPTGAPLIRIVGDPGGLSRSDVVGSIALGPERTMNQDVAYGIRMLVDIAERSLSSGPFEDPTTAVQAIDRLHEILRQLARRPLHSGAHHDAAGELRLLAPTMRWDGYVRVAFDEIRQAGAASPQVSRRLEAALKDLLTVPPDRRPALEHQLALLRSSAAVAALDDSDRKAALVPDPSGIGSAADLITATSTRQPQRPTLAERGPQARRSRRSSRWVSAAAAVMPIREFSHADPRVRWLEPVDRLPRKPAHTVGRRAATPAPAAGGRRRSRHARRTGPTGATG